MAVQCRKSQGCFFTPHFGGKPAPMRDWAKRGSALVFLSNPGNLHGHSETTLFLKTLYERIKYKFKEDITISWVFLMQEVHSDISHKMFVSSCPVAAQLSVFKKPQQLLKCMSPLVSCSLYPSPGNSTFTKY